MSVSQTLGQNWKDVFVHFCLAVRGLSQAPHLTTPTSLLLGETCLRLVELADGGLACLAWDFGKVTWMA